MSSAFSGYRYDKTAHALIVRFSDGSSYAYLEVPPDLYEEFHKVREPDSQGNFFNHRIRNAHKALKMDNVVPIRILPTAVALVQEAYGHLSRGQLEKASWRLADAMGEIKDAIELLEGSYSVQGITYPTDQGFQITNVTDKFKHIDDT